MGAKTWMLAYSSDNVIEILKSNPQLDWSESIKLVKRLFPSKKLKQIEDGYLSYTCPPDDEIYIGCFSGLSIIAASDFAIDYPSKLSQSFLNAATGHTVYLHAMHSVVDWFAYAIWQNGVLKRSLSLAPDYGILEDIGSKLSFEEPYWNGDYPAVDPAENDYPFPFHPLELGEAALKALFGYQLEGIIAPDLVEPDDIPLIGFKIIKPWWKVW